MEKSNIPFIAIIISFMFTSCDMIGDRQYKITDLNGTFVIRNYLDDGGTLGPISSDTLYLCDGKYKNQYFGEGKAEVNRQRTHAILVFKYKNPIKEGSMLNRGFHIDKPLFGKQRLTINSDLNYYYERISKECPDVFEKSE